MTTKVLRLLFGGLLATALVAAPYAALAQDAPKTESKQLAATSDRAGNTTSEAKPKRPLTAQQLKMKACGVKWKEEKATKGVKGRDAWNKFRSECMKG